MNALRKTVLILTLFSIAMGFLEAAVVVYLRELYYPKGFQFPLVPIPENIANVELLREAATIIMLLMIGIIAGKDLAERFAFFLFCFAVWDLFYYIFLKVILGWPSSFFTEDILFVIPIPWVGPVLAPCILSLTMIVITLLVVYFHERDIKVTINRREWLYLIAGAVVVIISFTMDYVQYIYASGYTMWTPMSQEELFNEIAHYIPSPFNWMVFFFGELLLVAGIISMIRRHRHHLVISDV